MGSSAKEQGELVVDGKSIQITSIDKPLWPKLDVRKLEYLNYLIKVGPTMLPFLKKRLLTVIRFPHGIGSESFYQKNCPEYAPEFIDTYKHDTIDYIVCNNLASLIWLGNQLAFEFHVPFATIDSSGPSEIVFDLDPPSRSYFHLAIKAATILKEICDQLKLISFVKTSGNKGLQVYIPLPENKYNYDDTRIFTKFVADYLIQKEPELFTIERLKKKRGTKLYIDYVQHAEGKTIIAPYSPRGNEDGLVATPLYWNEITERLNPEQFHLQNTISRIVKKGCPFSSYHKTKTTQNIEAVLSWLNQRVH